MPDPVIAPLAAFGLAMTILNILLSTAESLHKRYHEITDYADTIHVYEGTVFACVQTYNIWLKYYNRPDEQSYVDLFGDHWTAIRRTKLLVEKQIGELAELLQLKVPRAALEADSASQATSWRVRIKQRTTSVKSLVVSQWQAGKLHIRGKAPNPVPDANEGSQGLRQIPKGLAPGDVQEWQRYTATFLDAISGTQPEAAVVDRIVGLLGPNLRLKNKVGELKDATGNLEKSTSNAFRLAGHGKEASLMTDVERASDVATFRRLVRTLATQLRKQATNDAATNPHWFLELQFPDDFGKKSEAVTKILRDCQLTFAVGWIESTKRSPQALTVTRLHGRAAQEEADRLLDLKTVSSAFVTSGAWAVFLSEGLVITESAAPNTSLSFKVKSVAGTRTHIVNDWRAWINFCNRDNGALRQAFELERARLALGVVLWIILFWETDWFTHVCAHGFGFVVVPDDPPRLEHLYGLPPEVLSDPDNVYSIVNEDTSCRGVTDRGSRLYHLGILLAELALAEPISLTSDLGQTPRAVTRRGRPTGSFMSTEDIRNHRRLPPIFKDAIHFCFDKSVDRMWISDDVALAGERLQDFIDNAVEVVKKYHDVVKEEFKGQKAASFDELMEELGMH